MKMTEDRIKLKDLQFVIGAVAKKDYEPSLCHLEIKNRRAVAYGGHIAMSTPVACPFDVRPHAKSLVKAVQACGNNDIKLNMTAGGRLTVMSGKFRSHIECFPTEEEMHQPAPSGQYFELDEEFLKSITILAPFMSIDASRPWAQGLKIGHNSIYVTNNIILAQRWHGAKFPSEVIVPSDAIHELIRINEPPIGLQFNEHSITFFFEGDGPGKRRWLLSHLIAVDGGWGNADKIFEHNFAPEGLEEIDDDLYAAIDVLKPFFDSRGLVYLLGDRVATAATEGEGTSLDTAVPNGPIFHAMQLRALEKIATKINFSAYPKPCYFTGDKLRGVIVGVRPDIREDGK